MKENYRLGNVIASKLKAFTFGLSGAIDKPLLKKEMGEASTE